MNLKLENLRSKILPKAGEKLGRAIKRLPFEIRGSLPLLSLENSRTDYDAVTEVSYATSLSAGFDLKAADDLVIPPKEWRLVDTGLRLSQQSLRPSVRLRVGRVGFDIVAELQVRPRSGLAVKRGVTVLNAPGTVDADYQGKIMTCLINHGSEPFVIKKGDKISQGVFAWAIRPLAIAVTDRTRGEGGFGSTGR
jgi:dUTP pyrophosphatase